MTDEQIKSGQENPEPTAQEIALFQKEHPYGCADSIGAYEAMFPDQKDSGFVRWAPVAQNIDKLINKRGKMGYSLMTSFPLEREISGAGTMREVILIFSKK